MMESRLRWITVVLMLIELPQHSCDGPYLLKCSGANFQDSWINGKCESDPELQFNTTSRILKVTSPEPVTVEFRFVTTTTLSHDSSHFSKYTMRAVATDSVCSSEPSPPPPAAESYYWKVQDVQGGSKYGYVYVSVNISKSMRLESISDCESLYFNVIFDQKSSGATKRLALGIGISVGVLVMIIISVVVVVTRRRVPWHKLSPMNSRNSKDSDLSSVNDMSDLELGTPRLYSYKELNSATHSFSSKYVVGEGGFGTVYKGVLKDTGSAVAIKRLSQYAQQGAREFMAEVKIISQLRHRNLVQLLGWCLEKDELILVYEYMPNGDLDDLIYADQPKCDLSWKQRYNILCGVATALVYLHEEWEQRVIHRDVKTSNVMLDSNLNARLGDFGLARLSAHSQVPKSTLVAGTLGYLAPEFSMSGKATDKTDVYAFGVVALEVTCARRPLSPDLILVDWVWGLHKEERLLDAVDPRLDPKLRSTDDEVQMKIVLQVALLCCHPDHCARPSMRHVLNMLTEKTAQIPRVPRSKPVASYFEDD